MQLKPNETPDLRVGEKRRVTANIAGAAGVNSISSVDVTNDNMTITSPASSWLNITFFLEATQEGTFHTKVSAVLSSGETVIDYVRTRVRGVPCSTSADYDE
jgi:hypothetical protein